VTLETILGYFLLSQRKAAGTLLLNYILEGLYPILKDYNAVRADISVVQAIRKARER
jgi:hypothetical protein